MTRSQNIALVMIGGIIGFVIYSFLVSLTFHFLANLPLETATPISIWQHLTNASAFSDLQSKLFVAFGGPLLAFIFIASQLYKTDEKNQFGNAKWASQADIKKAGLLDSQGIILAKSKNQYLMNNAATHALLVAPTRSGKGAGVVIPTLLNWQGSLVCLDIKHENYQITAGFRKKCGQDVFMWAPSNTKGQSHCYNPLDYISRDPWRQISDLQVLTNILVPDDNKGSSFWEKEARAFFVGLAIYVIDNDDMPSTIGAINRLLGTEEDLGDICRHIIKTYKKTLPAAMVKTLMNFSNKAAKERSGVKSTLNSALMLWDNPAIDAVTSKSDFDIRKLRQKPMSIYVGVTTGQISALSPLIRIFFEQVITTLSMELPNNKEKHQVLLLLDEFHMLGKMDVMTKAFTLLAGYSARVIAVVQGLKFLDDTYGRDQRDGILSCCAHQIFYTANDLETSRYISDSCGEKTIQTTSTSKKKSYQYEVPTQSTSYRGRPLITKDEVRKLPKDKAIILVEASNPVLGDKIKYWEDRSFNERLQEPPTVPNLQFKNEIIPKFDIPDSANMREDIVDPNQIDFLNDTLQDDDDLLPYIFNDDEKEEDELLNQPPHKSAQ